MLTRNNPFAPASLALAIGLSAGMAWSDAAAAHAAAPPHSRAHHARFQSPVMAAGHGPMSIAPSFAGPPFAVGTQRPSHEVLLSIGEGELVTLPMAVASVWTSNPVVADVYVDNARQIHLFGRAAGEATVFATTAGGTVAYAARIRVGQNMSSIGQLMKLAMPDADVTVTVIGQFALLTGTVASPEDSAEAAKLVLVALNPGLKPSEADSAKIGVINRLRTAVPLQVNLQVRIAEVSRSLARTLGTNLTSLSGGGGGGFQFGVGQGRTGFAPTFAPGAPLGTNGAVAQPGTQVNPITSGTTLALAGKLLGLNVLAALDLGETVGLVTTLAQPNLTAVSGETAEFLVGGEFPIPTSQGLGSVSIEYKKYGVSLSYTPVVLADGRISLRVRPEVSELSAQGSVTLNGFTVPALTVRRAETTVELGSGQSFMIAGLLSNSASNTIQKMPGAGDLPVLGALFRSTNFQKNETELVIVITPYLVTPVNDRDIKLPTDAVKTPNILQEVLGNMVGDGSSQSARPLPSSPAQPSGSAATLASPAQPAAPSRHPQSPAPGFNLN
ncbi:MAG: type II and III secretion system protein family protein [Pseudomonadota bacterium]|nr:type II and III secretion system protein family protein [Pseudomonadota bacterium]